MRERTGSVERRDRGGKVTFRVKVTLPNGKRKLIQTCPTAADAEAFLTQYLKIAGRAAPAIGGITVRDRTEQYLNAREVDDVVADPGSDWSRFRNHIKDDPIGAMAIRAVATSDIEMLFARLSRKEAFVGGRVKDKSKKRRSKGTRLSKQSITNIICILSGMFDEAKSKGLVKVNPVAGAKFTTGRQKRKKEKTQDKWTFAPPDEQQALLEAASGGEGWIIVFAMGTGLRAGELVSLRLADISVAEPAPFVRVRFGGVPDLPPKWESYRTIPLFGIGLQAAREWLRILPTYAPNNPHGLMFPRKALTIAARQITCGGRSMTAREWADELGVTPAAIFTRIRRGQPIDAEKKRTRPRGESKPMKQPTSDRIFEGFRDESHVLEWKEWLRIKKNAGIARRFRWHDLRHTCGTSLVSGWWGINWPMKQISELLGHKNIETTEMYAHLGPTVLKQTAAKTDFQLSPNRPPAPVANEEKPQAFHGSRLRDLNSRPTVYENKDQPSNTSETIDESGDGGRLGDVSAAFLVAVAKGDEERAAALQKELTELVGQNRSRAIGLAAEILEKATKAPAEAIPIARALVGRR